MTAANITAGGINIATQISVQSSLLFCGALILLCLFTLLLFVKSKRRIYLYFFLFLLFSLLEAIIYLGHSKLIGSLAQITSDRASMLHELSTLLAYSCYCLFTIQFLNIKSQDKRLFYWIILMAVSGASYGIIYFFIHPSSSEIQFLSFLYSRLVILSMSIIAILWIIIKKIKSESIGYFLVGSAFYFLGALIAVLRGTIQNLPFPWLYQYHAEIYFQWGIFLEIICFTIALAVRAYNAYEKQQQEQIKRNETATQEKEIAQAEALALRIQINPHFLFNYLNVLKYYIQIDQNQKAIRYLVKFSQFIRKIIDSNQKTTISLEQELNIIDDYLALEEIRFENKFSYLLKTDTNIDIHQIQMPPMLLQPYVEDTLWSGINEDSGSQRQVIISIHQTETSTTISIEEDDLEPKRKKNLRERKFHKAINKEINAERIALYNKNFGQKISIEIISPEELQRRNKLSQTIIKFDKHENSHS